MTAAVVEIGSPRGESSLDIVIIGLTITSSWGNGHATTYRGLVRELAARGHRVLFLEADRQWYAAHRDMPTPPFGRTELYADATDLAWRFTSGVRNADLVIVGSFVPDGIAIGDWALRTAEGAVAFYDIDTPVTLAAIARGECDYLSHELIGRYDAYLSFTGGPTLERLERELGARRARPLYCSFDETLYHPEDQPVRWDLAYMGTHSDDRQPTVERLLLEPAARWADGRFAVVGPQYPENIEWPINVHREEHLAPSAHRAFYNQQRWTLNVTREDMIAAGWSPSVRLFEAAACGTPIISDRWAGLDEFLVPGEEVMLASSPEEVLQIIREIPDDERLALGARARERVLGAHTAVHRAAELERYTSELLSHA